jgi:methionine synthase II (cobalamin-independent)
MAFAPLTTTSVGSFPRPNWLAHTQRNQLTYRLEGDALKEAMDDAMALVIREQEELGLDVLTDGEMRRTTFIFHIAGQWQGVDTKNVVTKKIYRNREANRLVPRITGKIARRTPAAVDDLRAAKAHTDRPIKMAVPGPMTVIDSSSNEFYQDEEEFAFDVAAALNGELRDLQAAGCAVLQIDEPAMTRYHDKVRAHGAKALDRCLDGITVPTIVHLCYGYPGGGALQHQYQYEGVLPAADADTHQRLSRRIRPQLLRSAGAENLRRPHRHVRLRRSRRLAGADGRGGRAPRQRSSQIPRSRAGVARARLRPDDHQPCAGPRKAQGHGRGC